MQVRANSNLLIARMREEADAKEQSGKAQIARKARFAADSLEKCFGKDSDIALADVDKNWLDQYVAFLQHEGKSDNTISNYLRVILSTFRSAVKAGVNLNLTLFDGYFTGNSKSTKKILSAEAVKRILSSEFESSVFNRTRDIFSLCFFGGGLRVADLCDATPEVWSRLTATDEARHILQSYQRDELLTFLGAKPQQAFTHNLAGIAHKLNLKEHLDDDSAAEVWAELAKNIGVSHDVISAVIGRHIDNLNYANDAVVSDEDVTQALARVAKSMGMNTQHWYAIRCYEDSPEDTAAKIKALPLLKSSDIKHFFLDDEKSGHQNTAVQKNYMRSILFLCCLDADIYHIRRSFAPAIYVFDYCCGSEKRPAIISDNEMKTFMYLAGLGSDTITYYFPEELEKIPLFEEYEDVIITEGLFAGVKAKVHKKSKEKLNVIVRFEQANIWYTVDIPYSLLKSAHTN